jgi:hypothetical protein
MKRFSFFLIMLFSVSIFAQDLPRIAVYVTGDVPDNERRALGTVMLTSLVNSGRYRGIGSAAFIAEIEREQVAQRSGAIDDNRISELGRQFGVRYICIADITPAFGEFQVSARVVDVETAEVVFIGQAFSPLRSPDDLTQVSDEVVSIMFRGQATPQVTPAPRTAQPPVAPPTPRTPENVMEDGRQRVAAVPPAPTARSPRPTAFWAAIGLDVIGAGLIVYGIVENGSVGQDYRNRAEYDAINSSRRKRNIAYTVGTAALLGGITIHILF